MKPTFPSLALPSLALGCVLFFLAAAPGRAQLYFQGFANGTGSSQYITYIPTLNFNLGSKGTAYTTSSAYAPEISKNAGSDGATGYLTFALATSAPTHNYFIWDTGVAASSIDISSVGSFSFETNDAATDEAFQVTLEIGGSWYVSQSTFATASSPSWTLQSLTLSGATWDALNFASGTTLAVGSTTTLPTAGTLQGIGLYVADGSSSQVEVDGLSVNAVVPEPSTVALLFFSLLGLGAYARIKTKAARD